MVDPLVKRYTKLTKFLHWSIALVVICLLFSFFLDDVPKTSKATAIMLHKSFGLTVLGLMLIRFIWILHTGRPDLAPDSPRWERVLAHIVQRSFYLFLIAMPLSGWMMSTAAGHPPVYFNLYTLPFPGIAPNEGLGGLFFDAHKAIAFILIGLLILHVAGALKHHFIDKDHVLKRMLPGG